MTRLRLDDPWDLSLAVSAVVFAVALGFAVVRPAKALDPADGLRKGVRDAEATTLKASLVGAREGRRVDARTWSLPPEALGVRVMDAIGRVAEARHLELASFAVGRTIESAGLRQVPFTVTLAGAFPDLVAALQELERPAQRLVVNGVRVVPGAAQTPAPPTDAAVLPGLDAPAPATPGNRVTATVSLTAFLRPDPTVRKAP